MGIIIDKFNLETIMDRIYEGSDSYKEYKIKDDELNGVNDKMPREFVLDSVYPDMETRDEAMKCLKEINRI